MAKYVINAGELRHRITIQSPSNIQNEYGEIEVNSDETWIDFATVRASITPISGKEFFAAETVNSEITHKIKIRYIKGIASNMRVKFGDRYFDITSPPINFQEKNTELQLLCKELV